MAFLRAPRDSNGVRHVRFRVTLNTPEDFTSFATTKARQICLSQHCMSKACPFYHLRDGLWKVLATAKLLKDNLGNT